MIESMDFKISDLHNSYNQGKNIVQLLVDSNPDADRAEIIEIAYDVQAGSYTKTALDNPERLKRYAHEIHEISAPYLSDNDVILDCGAGELTTLSALSEHLPKQCQLLACDISLSRLRVGQGFAEHTMRGDLARNLDLFVADMGKLPLADGSVDVIVTSHALEPNHGREQHLLEELLRVARRQLLLFEPSWENANDAARERMEQHGYVRDLPQHIRAAGGRLIALEPLPNPLNPLNPTYCYVVESINKASQPSFAHQAFQCPRSGYLLQKQQSYWWSQEGGWAYPEIEGIPCLREKHGVLMSRA